jgi:PhnB protein
MRYKDSPEPQPPGMIPPGSENKIMHMNFRVGDSTIMASDGQCQGAPNFQGISLSISVNDTAEAEKIFAALAEGGQVQMPLTQTFFSPVSAWSPIVMVFPGWSLFREKYRSNVG